MVTMGRPKFVPKITPSRGFIPKLKYLPHPWIRPTYHPKLHPYLISRFATMHWTDRQTHTPIHTQTNRWLAGTSDNYRPLTLCRERHGIKIQLCYRFTAESADKIILKIGIFDEVTGKLVAYSFYLTHCSTLFFSAYILAHPKFNSPCPTDCGTS